jgi:AraC-like DNA-binding protein
MNLYEQNRSGNSGFEVRKNNDLTFEPHFHQNIEIAVILSGSSEVMVNGESFTVQAGSVVVVDNFLVHSYSNGAPQENNLFILPYDMLGEFNRIRKGKVFKKVHITDLQFAKRLSLIADDYLSKESSEYKKLSAINLIMALIVERFELVEGVSGSESGLIHKILTLTQEKFKESISLKTLSKELGYAEGHLSRVFHQYFKESFPHYVNGLRLSYIEKEGKKGEKSITELIFEAGFNSFQTYYRYKKQIGQN